MIYLNINQIQIKNQKKIPHQRDSMIKHQEATLTDLLTIASPEPKIRPIPDHQLSGDHNLGQRT